MLRRWWTALPLCGPIRGGKQTTLATAGAPAPMGHAPPPEEHPSDARNTHKILGWTITITRGTPPATPEADREHRNQVAMSRSVVVDIEPGTPDLLHIHRDALPLIERLRRIAEQAQGYRRAANWSTITIRSNLRLAELHGRFGAQTAVEPNPPTCL